MHFVTELRTGRLLMRRWRPSDREPFRAMNADAEVMAHFPAPASAPESDALIDRIEASFEQRGYGLWALESLSEGRFLGFTGLSFVRFEAHFTPAVEVGWRLAREAWGHGYATEAGAAAIGFAFAMGLTEVVSFTTVGNGRSRAVMQRLGMTHDPADDFDHPLLPAWPQRRHVLYRRRADAPA